MQIVFMELPSCRQTPDEVGVILGLNLARVHSPQVGGRLADPAGRNPRNHANRIEDVAHVPWTRGPILSLEDPIACGLDTASRGFRH